MKFVKLLIVGLFSLLLFPLKLLFYVPRRIRYALWRKKHLGPKSWITLELDGEVVEDKKRARWSRLVKRVLRSGSKDLVVMAELRQLADRIVAHPPAGVIAHIGSLDCGWAHAEEIRAQLERIRDATVLETRIRRDVSNIGYAIACVGQHVSVLPSGQVAPTGAAQTAAFFKDALAQLGIEMQTTSRGRYKSAIDPFRRMDRSEEDREQVQVLVDTFDGALTDMIAKDRKLDPERVHALIDQAPYTGRQAAETELIDEALSEEALIEARLDESSRLIDADDVVEGPSAPRLRFLPRPKKQVGLVIAKGVIVDGSSPFSMTQDQAVGRSVIDDLRLAQEDDDIGAVVFYVDSRGGSVSASDAIYGALQRLEKEKPVIACFGDYAASGGYYIGCGARKIVASPLTVTGSIGVFSAFPLAIQLADRLKLRFDTIKNRRHADYITPFRPRTEEESAHLQGQIDAYYDEFLAIVAKARGRTIEEVAELAEGRVWSGRDAMTRGLVDGLGGFREAVQMAKDEAKEKRFDREPVLVEASYRQQDQAPSGPPKKDGPEASHALRWVGSLLGAEIESKVVEELLTLSATTRTAAWLYEPTCLR